MRPCAALCGLVRPCAVLCYLSANSTPAKPLVDAQMRGGLLCSDLDEPKTLAEPRRPGDLARQPGAPSRRPRRVPTCTRARELLPPLWLRTLLPGVSSKGRQLLSPWHNLRGDPGSPGARRAATPTVPAL